MVGSRSTPLVQVISFVSVFGVLPLICSCMLHCLRLRAWSHKSPLAQQTRRHHNLQTLNLPGPLLYSVGCRDSHGRVAMEALVVLCFAGLAVDAVVVVSDVTKALWLVVMVALGSVLWCLLGTFQLLLDCFFSYRSLNLFLVPDDFLIERWPCCCDTEHGHCT